MRFGLPCCLAAGLVLLAAGCKPGYETEDHVYDPGKSDLENMLGEWVCVEATTAGEPDADRVGKGTEFTETMVLFRKKPSVDDGYQTGFELKPDSDPKLLITNAAVQGSSFRSVHISLYRFENGSLELCETSSPDVVPTEFKSTAENGYTVQVLKRVK